MEKVKQLKEYMKKNSIDICIFKQAENVFLFSGYWSRNGFSFFVLGVESEPMIVAPKGEYNDPKLGNVKDIRQFGYVRINDGNPHDNISTILKDYKSENDIKDDAKVAMDLGFEVIGVPICSGEISNIGEITLSMIKNVFKTDAIGSAKEGIISIRAIKDTNDIKKLEVANELGIMACNHFKEIVKIGEREIDLAAKVEAFFAMKASGYKGSRYGKAWVQISSGEKTAREGWFTGVVSEGKELEEGDMVMLEMGAVVDGYWCDLTSMAVVGEPTEFQVEILSIVKEAQRLAMSNMRPGAVAKDMYQIAMDYISSKGYGESYNHGLGHGLGFMYHEAIPALGPSSDDVLKEGMVMSCEPGIYLEGKFGVRWESNVLITSNGYKILGM